jgi:hypothetical protein
VVSQLVVTGGADAEAAGALSHPPLSSYDLHAKLYLPREESSLFESPSILCFPNLYRGSVLLLNWTLISRSIHQVIQMTL